jgi:adenylate cyclase
MAEERVQRRLAAILAADVVGFSRLMGDDESGTLTALKSVRAELIDPAIAAYRGRIVKLMGDGALVEFGSVVDAVECAVHIQENMSERNVRAPKDRRIEFRVGINLGDIIIDGDDIYGDGVNVAARLESEASPGCVCISEDAYRQVKGKVGHAFEYLGERTLKNISAPVRAYLWRQGISPDAVAPEPRARSVPISSKPSIAVLPFDNLSGDPEQDAFAEGMTEDLITDLSKISGLFVVARNSSAIYQGRNVDLRTMAGELGVRYVLEGSVRKSGQRVRINAQLIDTSTGGHLWAERYDGKVSDVFELQDEVGAKVVSALSVELTQSEAESLARVHTHNLDAYELFVRAKATPYPPVPARIDSARAMFEQVMEMDPKFAGGYAGTAMMLAWGSMFGHSDVTRLIDRAVELARRAIEVDQTFGWSYTALGLALLHRGQIEKAIEAGREAIERQPSDADAQAYLALILGLAGQPEKGVPHAERALRLNPQFVNGPYLNILGIAQVWVGDYEAAVKAFNNNMSRHGPVAPPALCHMVIAHRALGEKERAAEVFRRLTADFPQFTTTNWNFLSLIHPVEARERVIKLMRDAGLPEG